ncbi:BBIP10 domain containing protein [Trichuris trichiura]|uniref:BBIP10 domain containing protein n=1 Tax=Trichuris trichiura TaxID=36087 RepID=A0A077Z0E3_TRITR|nr:BBIP10 domain containing protein [Trichuris trichiura]
MNLETILPKNGMLFDEIELDPIFCKPKIMPLKSMTLVKLEKLQRQMEEKLEKTKDKGSEVGDLLNDASRETKVDVWKADVGL